MLRARWRGSTLGSGSDVWKYWDELRAGRITEEDWESVEERIASSPGHCMTMGTASTMTSAVEALGLTLPGAASIPAADSDHPRMAVAAGRRIVDLPEPPLSRESFENAVRVVLALGGSTNAVIHLVAMAGRAGIDLSLADFDELLPHGPGPREHPPVRQVPHAGLLRGRRPPRPDVPPGPARRPDRLRVDSSPQTLDGAEVFDDDVIRPVSNPLVSEGGLAILRGSLAPERSGHQALRRVRLAPDPHGPGGRLRGLPRHVRARRRPDLDVTADSVLVLRNAGPLGGPGMPEWGMLPIPKKLLKAGVRDMVRISDARMSGTAYGTCVLHVAPESFAGGPLALVQTGDTITLDVPNRRLDLHVSEDELAARRSPGCPESSPPPAATSACSRATSPRPTRAATSTSSTAPAASPSPRSIDDRPPWDVVVVGAGILGLATARELLLRRARTRASSSSSERPRSRPTRPATTPASSTRASTTRPGPSRPSSAPRAATPSTTTATSTGSPYERCGKLIIALDDTELPALDELERRGLENGVPGLRRLDAPSIREIEPHAVGVAALHSPETGIVDFAAVARTMAAEIQSLGARSTPASPSDRLTRNGRATIVDTSTGPIPTAQAVACAGLWSDRLAEASGESGDPRIIPFRGGYLKLKPARPPPRRSP